MARDHYIYRAEEDVGEDGGEDGAKCSGRMLMGSQPSSAGVPRIRICSQEPDQSSAV